MKDKALALLGGAHVHLADHLRHLRARGWRVSHVHDRDAARQDRLLRALGAEPVELDGLDRSDYAGALVCSETVYHEADIGAAQEAGLAVCTEKPMAGSAAAARRLAALAEARGLILHTGFFFRTNAGLRQLRRWLEQGAIGRVIEARMRFSHDGGYADWLDLDSWMTDAARACYGGFADEAVHALDALGWLIGPICDGHAVTGNALGWSVDDHGAAVLKFAGGATGVVEAGWTDSTMRLELDLVGETGAARLRDGVISVTGREQSEPSMTTPLSPLDAGEGIEPFLDVLEGKTPAGLISPSEAAQVNELLDRMTLRLA